MANVGNDSGRRRSSACLNKEWLKTMNNVGGDELGENVFSTILEVLKSTFKGKNGRAGGEVMTKTGYGGGLSMKKIFNMRDLTVGMDKWGERFRRVVNRKGVERTIIESASRRHCV